MPDDSVLRDDMREFLSAMFGYAPVGQLHHAVRVGIMEAVDEKPGEPGEKVKVFCRIIGLRLAGRLIEDGSCRHGMCFGECAICCPVGVDAFFERLVEMK